MERSPSQPEVNMSEDLYPIRLGYTLPSGEEYSVVITNEQQSEDEYYKMFSLCGNDIAFSVDDASESGGMQTE